MTSVCHFCKQEYSFGVDSHESRVMLRVVDVTDVVPVFKQYCLSQEDTNPRMKEVSHLLPQDLTGDARWNTLTEEVEKRSQVGCYEKAENHRRALIEQEIWKQARNEYAKTHLVEFEEDFPRDLQRRGRMFSDGSSLTGTSASS